MDLLIKSGNIYDPESGLKGKKDIYIKDGKISEITNVYNEKQLSDENLKIIDAQGLDVVPGFIDLHIHEDPMDGDVINYSTERAMLRMGVTTVLGGNCGFSPIDIDKYIKYIDEKGAPVNTLLLQGYNMIRGEFTRNAENQSLYRQGDVHASLTSENIAAAKEKIRESLSKGAMGLSLGLEYTPGCEFEELVEVCGVLKDFKNSLITVHYRSDLDGSIESVKECVELSKATGVPLEFSHIGSCSAYAGTYMHDCLRMLRDARAEGVDIIADCYPYNAFSTLIGSTVFDGGCFERWGVGYDSVLATQGKYKNCFCDKEIFEYLRKNEPDTRVVCFAMDDERVYEAYRDESVIVASDGKFINDQGHARTGGTFPRVLGLISREKKVLSFEEAIKKMTLLPAKRLHLGNKGRIRVGADADITIVNRETVLDGNSFLEPAAPPVGIEYVIVGGKISMEKGKMVSQSNGRFIHRCEL